VLASIEDGQVGVPTNPQLRIVFDEPLNGYDLGGVVLRDAGANGVPVSVTLSGDRRTLVVIPRQLLAANAAYTLSASGVEDLSGNVQALPFSASFQTADTVDLVMGTTTRFSVPVNNTQNVPLNAELIVDFSERVDPTSVNDNSFYLNDQTAGQRVAHTWTLSTDGKRLELVPDDPLDANHQYYFYVSYGTLLSDLAGNRVGYYDYRYFTTGAQTDAAPPAVAETNVASLSSVMPVNGKIVFVLTEPIGDQCPLANGVSLTTGGNGVPFVATLASDRRTVTVTPSANLSPSTFYGLSITGLCDYAGNVVTGDVVGFTTLATGTPDTTGPLLSSVAPANNSTGIATTTNVVMTFNEPVDMRTRPTLTAGAATVAGSHVVSGNVVTFTPAAPLAAATQYTVTYGTVLDVAGNARSIGVTRFTTQ